MNSRITDNQGRQTPYRFASQPLPFVWGRASWSAHPPTRPLVPLGPLLPLRFTTPSPRLQHLPAK